MEFSAAHLAAFGAYRARGFSLKGLTASQVDALAEDRNFAAEVSAHRRKVADEAERAATAATPAPPAPKAAPPKPWIRDLGTNEEQLGDEVDEAVRAAAEEGDHAKFTALFEKYEGCRDWPAVERELSRMWHLIALVANGNRKRQIAALEHRIVELEARPVGGSGGVKYCGIYNPNQRYAEGALVTRSGGLWLAQRAAIAETPGASPTAWLLIVKRGDAA